MMKDIIGGVLDEILEDYTIEGSVAKENFLSDEANKVFNILRLTLELASKHLYLEGRNDIFAEESAYKDKYFFDLSSFEIRTTILNPNNMVMPQGLFLNKEDLELAISKFKPLITSLKSGNKDLIQAALTSMRQIIGAEDDDL